MEELQSTDILDKEIQSDARKKAEKILSDADLECQKIIENVGNRIEESKKEREAFFNKKASDYGKNMEASLPLENQRFLVSYIESSVIDAINEYLKKLSEKKRLDLSAELVKKFLPVIGSKKINASVYGFNLADAKKMLESLLGKNLGETVQLDPSLVNENITNGIELHEGIILESEDKKLKCRATVDELISEIKNKYNSEIAVALFGGRLPE